MKTWQIIAIAIPLYFAVKNMLAVRRLRRKFDREKEFRDAHVAMFMRSAGMPQPMNPSDSHCATTRDGGEVLQ